MISIRKICVILVCFFFLVSAKAEEADSVSRRILSVYNFETGGSRNLSTYLSPLYYNGATFGLSASWTKPFNHWSDRCEMRFEASVNFDEALNPAKTARMMGLTARFGWGLAWSRPFARDWKVTVGPMFDLYGGALYQARNGNNPVSALASVGVDAAASLSWKNKIGRFPLIVSDEVSIPTLSGFFCPAYGESYYEIYLGNRKDLAHFGWWGNSFGINNLLSFKINFGKTGMMVGYRLDLRTFNANNLDNRLLRNAFVIGVIPNGF